MNSSGPVVPVVILSASGKIREETLDLTPKLRTIQGLLGGDVTFLGQWAEPCVSGVVLVVRRGQDESSGLPLLTGHKLQPPFHNKVIYGDVVLMRTGEDGIPIAFTEGEYDSWKKMKIEEFEVDEDEEEEDVDEDEDEDEDDGEEEDLEGDFGSDDDSGEEDDMMDFFLGHIVEKFEKEHGRAPEPEELEALKGALNDKLGGMMGGAGAEDEEEDELSAIAEEEEEEEGEEEEEEAAEEVVKPTKRARAEEETTKSSKKTKK